MLNNIDKENRINNWYSDFITHRDRTHTHRESKVTQTLIELLKVLKPTHSTKGNSKYHN